MNETETAVATIGAETFEDFQTQGVQSITLEQLEKSNREDNTWGQPQQGIYHFALIHAVLDAARAEGYNPEVYDLFAAQNRDKRYPGVSLNPKIEAVHGKRAVEAHTLRRIFANLRLTDMDDDELTTNLAVGFHQKGIQVGFGPMVKFCHNQCLLGAKNIAQTYSETGEGRGSGVEIAEILAIVQTWMREANKEISEQRETIRRMKERRVTPEEFQQFIGKLTIARVMHDTSYKPMRLNNVYPLNQGQISKFTESACRKYHDTDELTAWDMYNCATDLYKPQDMEIPTLLPQNRAMANFVLKEVMQ